jgi:hypothetical protein
MSNDQLLYGKKDKRIFFFFLLLISSIQFDFYAQVL